MKPHQLYLFGGTSPWTPSDWTASDDRVRGGASQSHLTITAPTPTTRETTARFHGTLDITTLGGAGFASQRTATSSRTWDLSGYDGVLLDVESGDGKVYTFIVKDEILPPADDGREQSTVSWEYDFRVEREDGERAQGQGGKRVWIPWGELKPTFRGKEKRDAAPLEVAGVRRFSLMMRSFFGTQEGEFSLVARSISAVRGTDEAGVGSRLSKEGVVGFGSGNDEKEIVDSRRAADDDREHPGLLNWLSTMCIVS